MKNKLKNKKILSITQILILLIGIFAFNYLVGEIGKQQGIEVSRGIGFVSAINITSPCTGKCVDSSSECPAGVNLYAQCAGERVCCKVFSDSQISDGPALPAEPQDEPFLGYEVGDKFVTEKGEEYKIKKEDIDKDGKIKEDSGAENWIKSLGLGYAGGKITSGVDKIFRGNKILNVAGQEVAKITLEKGWWVTEGTQGANFGTYAQAAAYPIIGAFLAWAFFKWIVKSDVRNMRDITTGAIVIGVGMATWSVLITAGVLAGPVGWAALGITFALVMIWGALKFKNYSQEVFTYIVTAWQAKKGGEFCEKCNGLKYGCTEYQCKSFGKGCEIVNPGSTQEKCVWKDPNDRFPPVINASPEVLPSADYSYQPLQVVQGVKIDYSKDPTGKGCIPPYTAVTLGIETDEFAECKIDTDRTPDYTSMIAPMSILEGFVKKYILSLPHVATPSVESQQAAGMLDIQITNGQSQEFFIRCEDVNGNYNIDEFIMEFCVQDGPDTSAPTILGTNFAGTGFLQYNQTDTNLEVYTNEPAECKWSLDDLSYNSMQFNMTQCSMIEGDYLFSSFGYGCKGTLTGLKDRIENKIYIRCKDKPWWTQTSQGQRYANENSFILTLMGTEPLIIDKIMVNGKSSGAKIKDSTETIKAKLEVTAKFGAQQGKARCQYDQGGNFVDFYNEGDIEFVNVNTQNLYLAEGDYNISIKCSDAGGNSDKGNIEFSIETDRDAPIVARAYYDVNNLKVITNEPAECVYTLQQNIGCAYNFVDGTAMSEIGELTHYTSWQAGKKYFIKCKDAFGNQPLLPNQCSIIVKAFESY